MLDALQLARYRICLRAGAKGLLLPPYKGSTLRGGFGQVFKRLTCALRESECHRCFLKEECPYSYIFETSPPPQSEALRNYRNLPRPFVLEPPPETKQEYKPGEQLLFNLVLIGKAIAFLPYFIVTFKEMGLAGIGRGRRPFLLDEVVAIHPYKGEAMIYSDASGVVQNIDYRFTAGDLQERILTGLKIRITFMTMTRLIDCEKPAATPQFSILIRQLLRRLSSLCLFHQDQPLDIDYKALIAKAHSVTMHDNQTVWVNWERYSSRQGTRMKLGGLVGPVVYEGELQEFWPLLITGEEVHVGKNTAFGLGKYRIDVL